MTRLTLPGLGYRGASIQRVRADSQLDNLDGSRQTILGRQDDFVVQVSMPPLSEAAAKPWWLFLMQAANLGNDFLLSPPNHIPTTYAGPNPVVNGADQLGFNLVCDGVTPSQAIVTAGSYISIGERLNMVTSDVVSDGSANCTFNLAKPLYTSPADNATVEVLNPQGAFVFLESKASIQLDHIVTAGVSFTAIEVR